MHKDDSHGDEAEVVVRANAETAAAVVSGLRSVGVDDAVREVFRP